MMRQHLGINFFPIKWPPPISWDYHFKRPAPINEAIHLDFFVVRVSCINDWLMRELPGSYGMATCLFLLLPLWSNIVC
jgi:hypothetical protein